MPNKSLEVKPESFLGAVNLYFYTEGYFIRDIFRRSPYVVDYTRVLGIEPRGNKASVFFSEGGDLISCIPCSGGDWANEFKVRDSAYGFSLLTFTKDYSISARVILLLLWTELFGRKIDSVWAGLIVLIFFPALFLLLYRQAPKFTFSRRLMKLEAVMYVTGGILVFVGVSVLWPCRHFSMPWMPSSFKHYACFKEMSSNPVKNELEH